MCLCCSSTAWLLTQQYAQTSVANSFDEQPWLLYFGLNGTLPERALFYAPFWTTFFVCSPFGTLSLSPAFYFFYNSVIKHTGNRPLLMSWRDGNYKNLSEVFWQCLLKLFMLPADCERGTKHSALWIPAEVFGQQTMQRCSAGDRHQHWNTSHLAYGTFLKLLYQGHFKICHFLLHFWFGPSPLRCLLTMHDQVSLMALVGISKGLSRFDFDIRYQPKTEHLYQTSSNI